MNLPGSSRTEKVSIERRFMGYVCTLIRRFVQAWHLFRNFLLSNGPSTILYSFKYGYGEDTRTDWIEIEHNLRNRPRGDFTEIRKRSNNDGKGKKRTVTTKPRVKN